MLLLGGCASFTNNAWRTEQAAVNAAFTAYVGYTNALASGVLKVTPQQSNDVRTARLKFAAAVSVADMTLAEYGTNAVSKSAVQSALATLADQQSNLVWVITWIKEPNP